MLKINFDNLKTKVETIFQDHKSPYKIWNGRKKTVFAATVAQLFYAYFSALWVKSHDLFFIYFPTQFEFILFIIK